MVRGMWGEGLARRCRRRDGMGGRAGDSAGRGSAEVGLGEEKRDVHGRPLDVPGKTVAGGVRGYNWSKGRFRGRWPNNQNGR